MIFQLTTTTTEAHGSGMGEPIDTEFVSEQADNDEQEEMPIHTLYKPREEPAVADWRDIP